MRLKNRVEKLEQTSGQAEVLVIQDELTPEQKEAVAKEHRRANGLPPEWPVIVICGKLANV